MAKFSVGDRVTMPGSREVSRVKAVNEASLNLEGEPATTYALSDLFGWWNESLLTMHEEAPPPPPQPIPCPECAGPPPFHTVDCLVRYG